MSLKENIGKGTIELVLLSLLSQEDMYGYQITQSIHSLSDGLLSINTGALYTSLYKLEEDGYITSIKKNVKTRQVRIYYHLTEAGQIHLAELMSDYIRLQNALSTILNLQNKPGDLHHD